MLIELGETVGTLMQLEWRCQAGSPDAEIDIHVAAASLTGEWPSDWRTGLKALQQELDRSRKGDWSQVDGWSQATGEFYERLNHALRSQELRWAEQEPPTEETNMATTTRKRASRKKAVRCESWLDDAGERMWRCPQCRNEAGELLKVCPCGYVRPTIEKLIEQESADGVPETQAEAAAKEAAAAGVDVVETVDATLIDWRKDNPRQDFDGEKLQTLAASIEQQGLLEPILLRQTPAGRFEGWAGERRFRAVTKELGRTQILGRIFPPETSDELMIRRRADENLERADLNPIERAESLRQKLLSYGWTPDSGDGPSMRTLAPQLKISQGELSNALRLLKLPASWQQRVISGEITVAGARALATWIDRPTVLAEVERVMKRSYHGRRAAEWGESEWRDVVADAVESVTRPCQPNAHFHVQRKAGTEYGTVAFTKKQIEKHADELDVIEVDVDDWRGKRKEKRAFNIDRWDALHAPLKKARDERDAKRAGGGSKATNGNAEPTASEKREKAKQQQKQLEGKVWRYKVTWLQARIAEKVIDVEGHVGTKLLLYFAADGHHWLGRRELLGATIRQAGGRTAGGRYGGIQRWKSLSSLDDVPGTIWPDVARKYLQALLLQDPFAGNTSVDAEDVPAIAEQLGVDLVNEWDVDRAFLELFTKDQLATLAKEWKLTKVLANVQGGKRGDQIDAFLQANKSLRLPAPKILQKAKG